MELVNKWLSERAQFEDTSLLYRIDGYMVYLCSSLVLGFDRVSQMGIYIRHRRSKPLNTDMMMVVVWRRERTEAPTEQKKVDCEPLVPIRFDALPFF